MGTATWEEPTATDDSGVAFIHSRTNYPGDSFYLWTARHEVKYTFSDAAGNLAYCTFYVTFEAGVCLLIRFNNPCFTPIHTPNP